MTEETTVTTPKDEFFNYHHSNIFGISVAILVIVIGFILMFLFPIPAVFFDIEKISPQLLLFEEEGTIKAIAEEIKKLDQVHGSTTVLFDGEYLLNEHTPKINEIMQEIPDVRQAFIHKIDPKLRQSTHKGNKMSNETLRYVLPVTISGSKKSGIWNDGQKKYFSCGKGIIYDNSRMHYLFNKNKRRYTHLLVIDIKRPETIPYGISSDETTYLI